MTVSYLTHGSLASIEFIKHGFFTRKAGVSEGFYHGLNIGLGSHDSKEHVIKNRALAMQAFGQSSNQLCMATQTHSAITVCIDSLDYVNHTRPEADGLVTNLPGVVLGISTADCVPILFADPTHRIIGAAHAGWKGAIGGILGSTVTAMEKLGSKPSSLIAVIGPCIQPISYEVSFGFKRPFLEEKAENEQFFSPSSKPDHAMFDLPGYVASKLRELGLLKIYDLGVDTKSNEELFFSYRRATLKGEPDYGRGLSAIMMTC